MGVSLCQKYQACHVDAGVWLYCGEGTWKNLAKPFLMFIAGILLNLVFEGPCRYQSNTAKIMDSFDLWHSLYCAIECLTVWVS